MTTATVTAAACDRCWRASNKASPVKRTCVCIPSPSNALEPDVRLALEEIVQGGWLPRRDARTDALVFLRVFSLLRLGGGAGGDEMKGLLSAAGDAYGDLSAMALETLPEWTHTLRVHFEDAGRAAVSSGALVRQQLGGEATDGDRVAIWDQEGGPDHWKKDARVLPTLVWALSQLRTQSVDRMEGAAQLVPFIVHVAEDFQPEHRLLGATLIGAFLGAVSAKLTVQMQLDRLFHQILVKNISFDGVEIKEKSLECLLDRLLPLPTMRLTTRQEWLDGLVVLLVKEATFCSAGEVLEVSPSLIAPLIAQVYLRSLATIVGQMSLAAVCHLKVLLALLLDSSQDTSSRTRNDLVAALLLAIFNSCWPRLAGHASLIRRIIANIPAHHLPPTLCTMSEQLEQMAEGAILAVQAQGQKK